MYIIPPRKLGSAVWRRIFCAVQSQVSAGILYVLQGKLAKHSAKKTSQTVLSSFRGGLLLNFPVVAKTVDSGGELAHIGVCSAV